MDSAIKLARLALYVAATFALVAIGATVLNIDYRVDDVTRHADAVLTNLDNTTSHLPELIKDGRLTLDNVNKGAIHERLYFEQTLPSLTSELQSTIGHVDTLVGDGSATMRTVGASVGDVSTHASTTLDAGTRTLNTTTTAVSSIVPVSDRAARTIGHADDILTSPELKQTLVNAQDATAQLDGVLHDAHDESSVLVHPKKRGWLRKLLGL